jgi:hypothetical protein
MTAAALFLAGLLAQPAPSGPGPSGLTVTPFVQQGAVFFGSGEVTAAGLGGGAGVEVAWRGRWLAQGDVAVLWGGGNVTVARIAAGVQRRGAWAPAAWLSGATLWGSRIETLDEAGRRPPWPTWAAGVRASPLRFAGAAGTVSVLEAGWARGPAGGTWLEVSILRAGVRW